MKKYLSLLPLLALYFVVNLQGLHAQTSKGKTVYITRTGEKYHTSSCRFIKQSGQALELKEAVKSYTPCKVCSPPKLSTESLSDAGSSKPEVKKANTEVEPKSTPTPKASGSVQCSGTTKAGARCKRKTTAQNGRCYQH